MIALTEEAYAAMDPSLIAARQLSLGLEYMEVELVFGVSESDRERGK